MLALPPAPTLDLKPRTNIFDLTYIVPFILFSTFMIGSGKYNTFSAATLLALEVAFQYTREETCSA